MKKTEMKTQKENKGVMEKLSKMWNINHKSTLDVLDNLDAKKWVDGKGLSIITHAGVIDNGHPDKIVGHNGYWISDGWSYALVTNGDPVWSDWDADTAGICGLAGGAIAEMLDNYKI